MTSENKIFITSCPSWNNGLTKLSFILLVRRHSDFYFKFPNNKFVKQIQVKVEKSKNDKISLNLE